ncbi:hypothetical protein Q3G72_026128 [Acer saccharum]|nr:hypothetical protein Q3G72_026128 [Acer saccharum]
MEEYLTKLTLLHCAIIRQNFDVIVEILNAKKELVFKVDRKQMNALHYVATTASDDVNIVALLSKEDVSLAYKRDSDGQILLHLVTKNGRFDVVKRLKKDYPNVIEVLDNKHLVA